MLWRDPHAPATTPYSLLIYATDQVRRLWLKMRRIPVDSRPVATDKCACFDQSEAPELVLELAASATTEDHESLSAWMCEVEERERNSDGDLLRVQVRPLDHRSCFCR